MSRVAIFLSIIALLVSSVSFLASFDELVGRYYSMEPVNYRVPAQLITFLSNSHSVADRQEIYISGFIGKAEDVDSYGLFISEDHANYAMKEFGMPLVSFKNECRDVIDKLIGKPVELHAIYHKKWHSLSDVSKIILLNRTNSHVSINVMCGLERNDTGK